MFPQRSRRDSQLRDEIWSAHRHAANAWSSALLQQVFKKLKRLRIFALAQIPDRCFA